MFTEKAKIVETSVTALSNEYAAIGSCERYHGIPRLLI